MQLYSFFNRGVSCVWIVNGTPCPLYTRKDTWYLLHGMLGGRSPVWTAAENIAVRQDSIPGLSSPQTVTKPIELSRKLQVNEKKIATQPYETKRDQNMWKRQQCNQWCWPLQCKVRYKTHSHCLYCTVIPRLTRTLLTNFSANEDFFRCFWDFANEYVFG